MSSPLFARALLPTFLYAFLPVSVDWHCPRLAHIFAVAIESMVLVDQRRWYYFLLADALDAVDGWLAMLERTIIGFVWVRAISVWSGSMRPLMVSTIVADAPVSHYVLHYFSYWRLLDETRLILCRLWMMLDPGWRDWWEGEESDGFHF